MDDQTESIPAAPSPPPLPPANCGALARLVIPVAGALATLVRPEGRALANPGGTEKFVHKKKIGHAFLKT